MSSNIPIDEKCITAFQDLLAFKHSALILKISDDNKMVVLEDATPAGDDEFSETWATVIKKLPEDNCRYIITDFKHKQTASVCNSKVCLIHWAPDNASTFPKMTYASSKDGLVSKIGIERSLQVNDTDELTYDSLKKRIFNK